MALDALGLARLLQLASPALPVGAYSYSGGLESAIEDGMVVDAASAERWIGDVLEFSLATYEAPILWRMSSALNNGDHDAFLNWNAIFKAGRETAELRAETLQMGGALKKLLAELSFCDDGALAVLARSDALTFPAAFAFAAHHMKVDAQAALVGYLWGWLENQVMAVLKAAPVGQTAGQKMLANPGPRLPPIAETATQLSDADFSNFNLGLPVPTLVLRFTTARWFRA